MEIIEEIRTLLDVLEKDLVAKKIENNTDKVKIIQKAKGCMGLIISLVEEGFLNELRSIDEVRDRLKSDGNPYTRELVSMNLLRLTKSPQKLIRRIKENGKFMYIKLK